MPFRTADGVRIGSRAEKAESAYPDGERINKRAYCVAGHQEYSMCFTFHRGLVAFIGIVRSP